MGTDDLRPTTGVAASLSDAGPARARGVAGDSTPHESATLHVTGRARYTDDLPAPAGTLHAAVGWAGHAHARIDALDLDAVRASPDVVAVLTAADVPGLNDFGGIVLDDPILADGTVSYEAQPLFLVVARTHRAARVAAKRARVAATPLPAILDVDSAIAAASWVLPPVTLERGDPDAALGAAPHRITRRTQVGGQEHFYLEGQVALAVPQDDGGVHLTCSTQHPTEVQHVVARALAVPDAWIRVECRRMGGGFGGKESQPAQFASLAAMAALRLGRPVKLRLDRDDDMLVTGKRHPFVIDYTAGFDDAGRLLAFDVRMAADCGYSADLSGPVGDRALAHVDNAYFVPHLRATSLRCRTHKCSNTAFRGFGGPQGIFAIEHAIDEIARVLGRDPVELRRLNYYDPPGAGTGRDTTPYGQPVDDAATMRRVTDELLATSDWAARRAQVARFNAGSPWVKRGLAFTPVKFGISFNALHLNQAGALLQLYSDGSLLVNHGGTEMGQGLNTKIAQVVARAFDVEPARVRVSATDTTKVPNTSATAASSGADLNGMATLDACTRLKARLATWLAERWQVPAGAIRWRDGAAGIDPELAPQAVADGVPSPRMTLQQVARGAYMDRVSLSAQGFYATPEIHWDARAFRGKPFFYFAYGAAVVEAEIDTLTGEHRMRRVDILHDVGASLNPAIDRGQVEGAFVQGAGWLTSEELVWDTRGSLRTHAPSTYKIPTAGDVPADFRVALLADAPNAAPTIHRSKAVGEPPLVLGIAAWHAIRDAVAACAVDGGIASTPGEKPGATTSDDACAVALDAPATPEAVWRACRVARGEAVAKG